MTTYAVEYTYDDRADARDEHRAAHRGYLAALLDAGHMIAFGRYDDLLPAGALLFFVAESTDAVEGMIRNDPFVQHGLVAAHTVRPWAGTWKGQD